MAWLDRLRRRPRSIDGLEETSREEHTCPCCEGRWLVSRGRFTLRGEVTAFVLSPTLHHGAAEVWLALGDGAAPTRWTCLRSFEQGDRIATGVVERADSRLRGVLGDVQVLTRAEALGDAAGKARLFAVHDALVRAHDDAQRLFDRGHGYDFTFNLPDCVFALPACERSSRNNKNFAELGDRRFVRALLPVPVSDGNELRIGVWVEVTPTGYDALRAVFWDDEAAYLAFELTGTIESALRLGDHVHRGTQVTMRARTADGCLFSTAANPPLATYLTGGISIVDLTSTLRRLQQRLGAN